ncbi:hypothetical protein [Actinoplanes sp. DH11]|uniref:hypothetical protein n=1 Tax=Actinoplanes sp. DH11 TaxID=2857011 RepID=UPI001E33944E|nr:hypothetical protein [Actinoplanes sp. DH11]
MTNPPVRPSGAGSLPLALAVGIVAGAVAFAVIYLVGPRTESLPPAPVAAVAGVLMAAVWTWRMYRHGWRLLRD